MAADAAPPRSRARLGGHVVADALAGHGITHAFCVPGESFLPVLDGLYERRDAIHLTTCRFEAGAVDMAEAVGKLSGRPAAAFVTRGPGACHGAIGVHVAQQDSTPLLLFVGQIPLAEADRESFQEVDYRRMFGALAKWVTQIDDAARIPELIAHAVDVATSGRPGPVVIALSEEMQQQHVEVPDRAPIAVARPCPDPAALTRLRDMLAGARRPLLLLGGGGWTEAGRAAIGAFARAHGLPVAVAFRRHALYDGTHPGFVGDLGVAADPGLVAMVRESDLVLAVGARLAEATTQGYTLFDPPFAGDLVHVYPDAAEIGRVFRPALGIATDLEAFARALAAWPAPERRAWDEWRARLRARRMAQAAVPDFPGKLNVAACLHALSDMLEPDAVLTTDAGNFATWPSRFMQFGDRQRYIGPTCGAMGYAVPAAIGAAIAHPGRQCIAFVGDGGFLMTGQELATALQYGAAPIVLVFDNGMYGTIRMYQERAYPGRVSGTALRNPDFARLAEAYGAHGETVRDTASFAPAFRRAVASGRASVIALMTDPEQITTRATIAELRAQAAR
jgi:acetolactate synthase-1/2/3 large subunit